MRYARVYLYINLNARRNALLVTVKKIIPMNKKYVLELADYNIWANNIAVEWLNQITDEQWKQVITSSFSSIERTAIHIVSAQKIWIDYWNSVPAPVFLSAGFNGSKNDLIAIWKNV